MVLLSYKYLKLSVIKVWTVMYAFSGKESKELLNFVYIENYILLSEFTFSVSKKKNWIKQNKIYILESIGRFLYNVKVIWFIAFIFSCYSYIDWLFIYWLVGSLSFELMSSLTDWSIYLLIHLSCWMVKKEQRNITFLMNSFSSVFQNN